MSKLTPDSTEAHSPEVKQSLDELAREGACRMTVAALEAEVEAHLQKLHRLPDEQGHAMVVCRPWWTDCRSDSRRERKRCCAR